MDSNTDPRQDDGDFVPNGYLDYDKLQAPMNSQLNQLTVSTIISIASDCEHNCKPDPLDTTFYNEKSVSDSTLNSEKQEPTKEKWYFLLIQVSIPFLVAGMGTIGAGVILANVENYRVFKEVKALYILVPALLGLKGNLDMCLASRLSTQANLGNVKGRKEKVHMIIGNLGLVQVQSIVASFLVSIFAVSVSAIMNGNFVINDALLLCASSTLTATLSCFVLDLLLISLIFLSRKANLNPDNLATPFAASIGDLVSLVMLSTWASFLYEIHDKYIWVIITILLVYLLVLLPTWIIIVKKNTYTSNILLHGWTPVLSALFISGMGGLVLNSAVDQFSGFAVFQPIINGIGGNLVSVQSSRTSTLLHQTSLMGVIPPHTKQWVWPWTALFRGKIVMPANTARLLILMSVPGHAAFAFFADLIYKHGESSIQPVFLLSYLIVGVIQILCLLYICHIMVHTMWTFKIDPDNSAIPYLTSIGDLLGSSLLLLAFMTLRAINSDLEYT